MRTLQWPVDELHGEDFVLATTSGFFFWHSSEEVLANPHVTHGQLVVVSFATTECSRRAGGFLGVLRGVVPAMLWVALDHAEEVGLDEYAEHLEQAVGKVFTDGFPRDRNEEEAAWDRFERRHGWDGDAGAVMAAANRGIDPDALWDALERYIRENPQSFFVERSDTASLGERLDYADLSLRTSFWHHFAATQLRSLIVRNLRDAIAAGDPRAEARCREALDRWTQRDDAEQNPRDVQAQRRARRMNVFRD